MQGSSNNIPTGRFAPSPSGRMHLGNIFTAFLSWLSVKTRGGQWILRIEDLDRGRSRMEYARQIEEDLHWLGLEWDQGGLGNIGNHGPYLQSQRNDIYSDALQKLARHSKIYPCYCTRADLMASNAPHLSDGRRIYPGTCRPKEETGFLSTQELTRGQLISNGRTGALRLAVENAEIYFKDIILGDCNYNLAKDCGDFILRRTNGEWAYQLAVTVDDAEMGVTEVLRANDLLQSTPQQLYLRKLLGYSSPIEFAHTPLLCNINGQRLSKRDKSLDMGHLREQYSANEIIGILSYYAHLTLTPNPISPSELAKTTDYQTFLKKIRELPGMIVLQ